jgi:peptide/nickel transport system permease protein
MAAPMSDLELETSSVEGAPEGGDPTVAIRGRSPLQLAWLRLRHDRVSLTAMLFVIFFALVAIIAPILSSAGIIDPYTFHNTGADSLVGGPGTVPNGPWGGISTDHWFGVEPGTGRDVLSRIVLGIAFSLMIATGSVIVSCVLGMVVGIITGYMGGVTDFFFGRFMDVILSFPQLLMLLALSPVLKQRIADLIGESNQGAVSVSAIYLIAVLGFFGWPYLARIIRGQVLTLRNREFVEAARSLGATRRRIWFRELLPNLWAPLIVYASLTLPQFIGAEAALSYLGVGIQAPTPSLGNILNDAVSWYDPDPAFFFLPGIVLVLVVLAFNMFGDGLRDALDPKSGR